MKRKMTLQEAIDKDIYIAILCAISTFQKKKIRFWHLKYVLVWHHGIKNPKEIKRLDEFFGDELIKTPYHYLFVNTTKKRNKYQFKKIRLIKGKWGVNNLTNYLEKLESYGLIISKKEKGERFPYYELTLQGTSVYVRKWIKDYVDYAPDKKIIELMEWIKTVGFHIELRKRENKE